MKFPLKRLRHAVTFAVSLAALAISVMAVRPEAQAPAAPAAQPPVINQSTDPLLRPFRFRSIGPASMHTSPRGAAAAPTAATASARTS